MSRDRAPAWLQLAALVAVFVVIQGAMETAASVWQLIQQEPISLEAAIGPLLLALSFAIFRTYDRAR